MELMLSRTLAFTDQLPSIELHMKRNMGHFYNYEIVVARRLIRLSDEPIDGAHCFDDLGDADWPTL